VEERLFALIRALKDSTAIHPSMNLELDLRFSSLERVELLSSIQEAFGVAIGEADASKIHTVGELAAVVERLAAGPAGRPEDSRVSWGAILSAPLDGEEDRIAREDLRNKPFLETLRFLLSKVFRVAARLLLRFRVEGIGNLPERGAFLICPNHVSYLDAFLLMAALPYTVSRKIFFLGDVSYFEGPLMRRVASWLKVVRLSPDRAVRSSLRLSALGLSRGMVLCVFPEGERSIDGRVKPFRKGPAIVATELGLPVVPVGIQGAYEVWPRGSNRIRLRPVRVKFGPPLSAAGKSADAFNEELRDNVERLL
jgi:long-chain acyl-CoA synthetase